ncbi:MAG: protein translocase SEC61 complex subunit gamma [Thermoplasmata archaeon]|jgi:protein transport protein SEC61 subunit gamma-like protein|nr:protein translocase SEC61 complex subunit gamma [Euryarchaeota archaeon]MVT14932.1 protein translocase SEC61 complex subunit gamma [Euryarchaeota archaeon]MVT35212.1 protein translocase SEC61 complex subunit gamma [Euryarchaeota archaeon]
MTVVDTFEEIQEKIEDWFSRIGKGRYSRVLKMARKPTRDEYVKVVGITALGIVIIGTIGFIIYYIMVILTKVP